MQAILPSNSSLYLHIQSILWHFPACSTPESRVMTLDKRRNSESVPDMLLVHGEHFILLPNTGESVGFEVIGYCKKKDKSIE